MKKELLKRLAEVEKKRDEIRAELTQLLGISKVNKKPARNRLSLAGRKNAS